ncbi:protein MEMO1-like [Oppia nitens]|uniref:protein MEMO1-like n=1 Tax=Oppia nitens TaxID=1686743 RepID=UPI0023DCB6AD|nr:protein MEMO1-like [Oppia nitens]
MSSEMVVRRASHANNWYSGSAKELRNQLETWLTTAGSSTHGPARAIIAPHAGYHYCGACAAYAYKEISPQTTKRVFILGPAHHIRLGGCALSPAKVYKTPLYDLNIDQKIYSELYETQMFEEMTLHTDEDEHSIEMHLPYVARVMEGQSFTIVPILVGSLTTEKEVLYGKLLSKYLADIDNVFVISSDFCHWGNRFGYQYYDKSAGDIYQSIQKLDEIGMNAIEKLIPSGFSSYLKKYGNTICGRHPIGVLLNAVHELGNSGNEHNAALKFLKYSQSSKCLYMGDSSVSYAAASLKMD